MKTLNKRVLILGGYGTFGSRIAQLLGSDPALHLIIAGRDKLKAAETASRLPTSAESLRLQRDAINLSAQLEDLHLDLLIHCAGPFQNQDYRVARACIDARIPYIDIADARRFVCDFPRLSNAAQRAGVTLVSGASSLSALSSAVLQQAQRELAEIHTADIVIAPAHRISRGPATVRAGFESLGRGFPVLQDDRWHETFAGGSLRHTRLAHPVGGRYVCDFDVPDLELWPRQLPALSSVRFGTGVQPRALQLGLALCARLARLNLPATTPRLARLAGSLASRWPGGSPHGGMKVLISGRDGSGMPCTYQWQILGLNADGPWIPAAPAAALARKFLSGQAPAQGAHTCWQLLTLEDILAELAPYSVVTATQKKTPAELARKGANRV
ncbi:saccharopine dehydrogenase NADP-binding domain-containing protein [Microbulbifer sp. 2201CG32-9]|uniref:saccharopine dehydrogenase NADP-binding domain-containing protein n=1 Tax=Microbulbifer sp. 2201CG32-9 TaxID=3232309 RepID=UPI00345C4CD9